MARVCDGSLAKITGSNPAGSMDACVLSDRCLCVGPITRPEESYRLQYVTFRNLEISRMRRPWPALDCHARGGGGGVGGGGGGG